MSTEKVDPATDEEVAEIEQILSFGGLDLGISNKAVAKLLARLEAVERELRGYRFREDLEP